MSDIYKTGYIYELFILLFFVGCSHPKERAYREYVEGPHILTNKHNVKELNYFKFKDSLWVSTKKPLSSNSVIKVDNPLIPEFEIILRDIKNQYPSEYSPTDRMMVISDIEGNISSFISLLVGQKVIDKKGNWTFGDGDLVILGDTFDRGPDVTPLLWLLYRLEAEAADHGGRVHILLGNHENMIFDGDIRYIHPKYKKQSMDVGISYDSLYSINTVLGQWLRHKPAVIKIGKLLLSHAGISPEIMKLELSLDTINKIVKDVNLNRSAVNGNTFSIAVFGSKGIFWYRDWVDSPGSENELDRILEFYDADHMIVGHTIVPKIKTLFNNKLIAIDIKSSTDRDIKELYSLGYENGQFSVRNKEGGKVPVD